MTPPTMKPVFAIAPGAGDLPRLALVAPDGARAEVYLHGAHVASWVLTGGQERLFLSRASQFHADAPIRGGVPVVFPQFGGLGPLPLHGWGRAPFVTMSDTATRPPGFSAQNTLRKAYGLSGETLIAQLEIATSTLLSSIGSSVRW